MADNGWTPDQPMVSIRDVHKSFGSLEVLKGVSMDIMKGECICIIGHTSSMFSCPYGIFVGVKLQVTHSKYVLHKVSST